MRLNLELPDWLEACRPDDGLYADAYEGTAAELRALLKTAIAFAFHRWPRMDGARSEERHCPRAGFRHTESSHPVDWVLAVLGSGFASPARLLSALVPAVIAGTGRIVIVSEAPFSPAVCTALELAGMEDSFLVDAEALPGLYEDLRAISPEGRLAFFPGTDGTFSEAQKTLMHAAALDGMPRLRDLPAPRLLSLHDDAETVARLRWLHPDAELLIAADLPDISDLSGIDAVFAPADGMPSIPSPFLCGPGMEACWPGPSPEFYRTCSCSAFLVQENLETL